MLLRLVSNDQQIINIHEDEGDFAICMSLDVQTWVNLGRSESQTPLASC